MALGNLGARLQGIFDKLKNKGRLTEENISEALREVRVALLEADVNYKVAKEFIAKVKERAVGSEVLESLTPGQQVVKIVHEELTALMGESQARLATAPKPPTVILMAGLQGSGKTTTVGKLALWLKGQGKRPLLAAADIYRPAAIRQLEVLGEKIGVPVFALGDQISPVEIAGRALDLAVKQGHDYLIIDTAGRLQINQELMEELSAIKERVEPTEILLVVDAMAGQDAVNVAAAFDAQLAITGIILTKLDGDTRGGAALSVKAITGRPIKFTGTGEKLEALEPFHPDRMASRILGMGDVLSLIEKAQAGIDEEQARQMEARLRQSLFTFDDYLEQLEQMKKMGSMQEILGMVPGLGKQLKNIQVDEKQLVYVEAMIKSMTPAEREHPSIINGSRKLRIAKGSGRQVQDVNRLLRQFEQMQKMLKQMNAMEGAANKKGKKGKGSKLPFGKLPFI